MRARENGGDGGFRGHESSTSPRLSGTFLVLVSIPPQLEGKFTGHHVCGIAPNLSAVEFAVQKNRFSSVGLPAFSII